MAEAYTVLARRYRSQTFDELVGQEAVAQTLKNAIRTNHVAHAFIFTGTRGVGKTSSARILAKAVNCPNRTPEGNPCGVCETCRAIARGEDMDVIEIDGASNNSVDQIRELRQSAGIRPAKSEYKIYIIDEVHMLTGGAFNALLKTLEEPPAHVKFIFATTDIHKVPATIISRCQRFDFKNIPTQRIADHLAQICKDEGVTADAEAIFRVARLGNGSMRDALSIMDRVLSMGEKHITDATLEELLGKPPTQAIGGLVEAVANGDAAGAITRADALLKDGMGVEQVLGEIVDFLRNLMIVAACGPKTELLEVPAEAKATVTGLAEKFDAPTLVHLIALSEQTLRSLKSSTMQRPLFDALIVRLALSEQFSTIRQAMASTESAQGHANPQDAGQKKSEIAPDVGAAGSAAKVEAGAAAHESPATESTTTEPLAAEPLAAEPVAVESPTAGSDEEEENIYEVMKGHMRRQKEELEVRSAQARQQPRTGGRPGPQGAMPASAAPKLVVKVRDVGDLAAVWEATRAHLQEHVRYLESVLGHCCHLASLDPATGEAVLVVPGNQQGFTNEKARAKLEESLRAVTGLGIRLALQFAEVDAGAVAQEASRAGTAPVHSSQRVPAEVMEAVKEQRVVQQLMKQLDANVVHVELLGTNEEE